MISINHLSITYNKSADILKNINLNIENGEIIALLGHNGSGKSTLIKCISGVLKPTQGCVTFDNINVFENRKKIIPDIGVVFNQKPSFIIDISVYDNLLFFKAIYELNNIHFAKNLELIDKYLDVSHLYRKPYRKLSFGERVKCEIASVLLHSPRYIILDEPTIGLDYNAKKVI
jgi:ABC-2 type transport system ATP-binding protein